MGAPTVLPVATAGSTAARAGIAGSLLAGGIALVIGALMPWVQVTVPIAGTITRTGVDSGNDAVFCIVVGAAACLLGVRIVLPGGSRARSVTERAAEAVVGIFGLVCAVFAVLAAKHVDDRLGSILDHLPGVVRTLVNGEVGAGIWVVLAGGAVVALAAFAQVAVSAPPRP